MKEDKVEHQHLFSTEQVSASHPDKYADQISDAIVALAYSRAVSPKCAIETMVKDNVVVVAGELGDVNLSKREIKSAIKAVGRRLHYKISKIVYLIGKQSIQINKAVSKPELCAGDQGLMFGYATSESPSYLPYAFDLANKIIESLKGLSFLKGDAKCQVTTDLGAPFGTITSVLVSACYNENKISLRDLRQWLTDYLSARFCLNPSVFVINPSGEWTIGGAKADSGLTGRKIVCDQYGGYCAVGGGSFSGKDLSKVDRSGAYAARNIAIDLLRKYYPYGIHNIEVQLAYDIGIAKPVSISAKVDGHFSVRLTRYIERTYDLRPQAIIDRLALTPDDFITLSQGCHYRNGYVGRWDDKK